MVSASGSYYRSPDRSAVVQPVFAAAIEFYHRSNCGLFRALSLDERETVTRAGSFFAELRNGRAVRSWGWDYLHFCARRRTGHNPLSFTAKNGKRDLRRNERAGVYVDQLDQVSVFHRQWSDHARIDESELNFSPTGALGSLVRCLAESADS